MSTETAYHPTGYSVPSTRYRPNDPSDSPVPTVGDGKPRYCLYARKSSEDDERQALSIDSQIAEMAKVAERDGLKIVEIVRESKSAKASGAREGFNNLLNGLAQRRYDSILAWAPDRLSRNAGDLGSVVDLMDRGCLREIRTNGQTFANNPNEKFLLMILCSQAKLENDNRSVNVCRGLRTKASIGHFPHITPLGYLNQRSYVRNGGRTILDPERAPFIKEIFEKAAYSGWSGRKNHDWIRKETPFKTRSGNDLTLSTIYKILNNPFYYGKFEYPKGSGNWCDGDYKPIITKKLFDEAQEHLDRSPRYRPRNKDFEFTKLMKCGNCGSSITAQEKFKKIAGQEKPKSYVYYHCDRHLDRSCREPSIREDALIQQFIEVIDRIDIDVISVSESLKDELARFNAFQSQLLRIKWQDLAEGKEIDLRAYMKYIIRSGSKDEKRNAMAMIQGIILLKGKKILD